eukprot:COSAG01_NODE_3828_length_5655_cov_3.721742_4_plen_96_part_00
MQEREGRQAARERAEHWMARAQAAEAAAATSERRRRKEVSSVSALHLPADIGRAGRATGITRSTGHTRSTDTGWREGRSECFLKVSSAAYSPGYE